MKLTIELPDDLGAALKAKARAEGVSPDQFIRRVLHDTLTPVTEQGDTSQPFETGYGMWAKYGPAPSAEEIDENRGAMFRRFAQDL
jgi:hypothetical protein